MPRCPNCIITFNGILVTQFRSVTGRSSTSGDGKTGKTCIQGLVNAILTVNCKISGSETYIYPMHCNGKSMWRVSCRQQDHEYRLLKVKLHGWNNVVVKGHVGFCLLLISHYLKFTKTIHSHLIPLSERLLATPTIHHAREQQLEELCGLES